MLSLPGAVLNTEVCRPDDAQEVTSSPSILFALHYGDPFGEQWALEAGRGLVDRSDLKVVTVTGPDRHTWLTSLTTQVLTGMGPGISRELLILDPYGHIAHAAAVLDDGEATHLITEGVDAEKLAEFLCSMRFTVRVDVQLREDLSIFATAGSQDTTHGLPGHLLTWTDPWPGMCEGGAAYFQGTHPGASARMRLHLVDEACSADFFTAWREADTTRRPAGLLAWEALRIAAWRPRFGYETDSRSHPAELDWLRTAVHTNKGCYRGQEAVARIINLGRPPRRLVFLHLDGSRGDLPERGTKIYLKERVVGVLTSVARHAELGPIALALLARNVPAETVFDLDGIAAAQEVIVPLDGKSSISPDRRPGLELTHPELRRRDLPKTGVGGRAGLSGLGVQR